MARLRGCLAKVYPVIESSIDNMQICKAIQKKKIGGKKKVKEKKKKKKGTKKKD
jgi:hypothetical protein